MLPVFLFFLLLLSSTHGLHFSHFPVTVGRVDTVEDPPEHVRPTGRPVVAGGGGGDALLALLASGDFTTEGYESVDEKERITDKVSRDKSRHSDSLKRQQGSVDQNPNSQERANSKHRETPSKSRLGSISGSRNRQDLSLSRSINIHARKKTSNGNSMLKMDHKPNNGRRQYTKKRYQAGIITKMKQRTM